MREYFIKGASLPDDERTARDLSIWKLQALCTGILADGVVNEAEGIAFREWVERVHRQHPVWPITDVIARLKRIFADGVCDDEERAELKHVMEALCGTREAPAGEVPAEAAILLPQDTPAPVVIFEGRQFAVTGNFVYGKRAAVIEAIAACGGIGRDAAPSASTDYLVIGAVPSKDWKHGSFGRKIESAMEMKKQGSRLAVISEEHWRRAVAAFQSQR